ncbi:MAG: hypothetical protein KDN19_17900 [Verrucomicrobiae bacterium]|nr:hypothetical protein [Verrucomicrobiae bacterium]
MARFLAKSGHGNRLHRRRPSGTMAAVKALRIVLWLVIGVLLIGNAYHFAKYDSIGLFEWSARRSGDGMSIVRTAAIPPAAGNAETPAETDPKIETTTAPEVTTIAPEVAKAAAPKPEKKPEPPKDPNLHVLFDGKKLGKWEPIQFGGEGEVQVNEKGAIEFDFGAIMTGVKWSEEPPATSNYEIELDAMKLDGNDFFCALTFPVKDTHATFVIGGWGGGIVGISSVDDLDASENETMNVEGFENDVWYHIKVRVTDEKIEAWIDDRQMVDLELGDKKISLRPGDIELCVPVGIASFMTRAQYRDITWRDLK